MFLSNKIKTKKQIKPKLNNHATLTDTESNKMHDLLKKGYSNGKSKKPIINTRTKSKSISGANPVKNKLKSIKEKNLSNSRSPGRIESVSSESNRKFKSTMASTDLKRSQPLRNSGESVSIASEKPKAVYFKNTLESHNKIMQSSVKSCKFMKFSR